MLQRAQSLLQLWENIKRPRNRNPNPHLGKPGVMESPAQTSLESWNHPLKPSAVSLPGMGIAHSCQGQQGGNKASCQPCLILSPTKPSREPAAAPGPKWPELLLAPCSSPTISQSGNSSNVARLVKSNSASVIL